MTRHASDEHTQGVIEAQAKKKHARSELLTLAQIAERYGPEHYRPEHYDADEHEQNAQHHNPLRKHSAKRPQKARRQGCMRRIGRVLSWCLGIPVVLCLLLAGAIALVTSPRAEGMLTQFIAKHINEATAPFGMRVYIGSVSGFWQGEIRVLNLRIHDTYGPWLHVDEATLHPLWTSVLYGARAVVQAQRGETITTQAETAPVDHNISTNIEQYQRDVDSVVSDSAVTDAATQGDAASETMTQEDIMDNLLEAESVLRHKVVLALRDGTIIGVRMPRFPHYIAPEEVREDAQDALRPLSFLPRWLALDIGELEISDFLLGPVGRNVYISGRVHGQLNCEAARIRSTVMLEKDKPKQWVLPATQDLPGDVTLTVKELRHRSGMGTVGAFQNLRELGEKKLIAFLSFDARKENFDVRMRLRDELVVPSFLSGVDRVWTRARVLGRIPLWPPTKENPVHLVMASRYGVTFAKASFAEEKPRRIRASLASAQVLWDGERLVLRDVSVVSPIKEPFLNVSASLGVAKEEGLGVIVRVGVEDVTPLAQALDANIERGDIQGKANLTFTALRSGEHLMWWTKPLPPVQEGRNLPGFEASSKDFSVLGKQLAVVTAGIRKTLATIGKRHNIAMVRGETRLPPPSDSPSAMGVQVKIESPLLQLPNGTLKDVYISIRGTSVEAQDSPGGTGQTKTAQGKEFVSDFSARGIPQGLVGTARVRCGDIYSMGTGTLEGGWFLGGLHEKASVFLADLEHFALKLPGVSGEADIGFAYALPVVKRRWPWMDGTLNLRVDHWRLLAALLDSPLRGNDVTLTSSLKSFLDTNGKPQQYFTSNVRAQRLDAAKFMVQDVHGVVESKYVHALADVFALAAGPLWQAKLKKVEYNVPDGAELLTSSLNLSQGRSGSFRWNWGSYVGTVEGEDADFTIKMNGDIDASLDGSFNFRKRLLSLGKMQLKTLKE